MKPGPRKQQLSYLGVISQLSPLKSTKSDPNTKGTFQAFSFQGKQLFLGATLILHFEGLQVQVSAILARHVQSILVISHGLINRNELSQSAQHFLHGMDALRQTHRGIVPLVQYYIIADILHKLRQLYTGMYYHQKILHINFYIVKILECHCTSCFELIE